MAQPFKFKHQNEIVGAFVIVAVLTLLAAFVVLVRGQDWFEDHIEITAVFETHGVGLLQEGVSVRVRNNTIGRVKEAHHVTATRTDVTLLINSDRLSDVNKDSTGILYVPFAGLPGKPYLEIRPGNSHEAIAPGESIRCRLAPDIVQLAVGVLDDVHRELTPTFKEITKLSKNLNRIIAAMEKSGQVEKNLARVDKLYTGIDSLLTKVDKLMASASTTMVTVNSTLGGVDKIVAKADHGGGLVSQALNDRKAYAKLMSTLGRLQGSMIMAERLLVRADKAGKDLPQMAELGVAALKDMVVLSKELKRLAPMLPNMAGQVDEVLFESRSLMAQAERHWLFGSALKASDDQPLLVPSGIHDRPRGKPLSQLRQELRTGTSSPSKAVGAQTPKTTRPGGPPSSP